MTLSILIVNWNSKDYLRDCLRSIRATCAELAPQIVVVDGGSFDGCGEMLASGFPEVEFVQSQENLGFGRSNNLGFERVRGEILLLLNPDCELRSGAVPALLHALRTFPAAGLVGPRLLNTNGSLQTSCVRAAPTPLNRALDAECLRRWFPYSRLWGTRAAFRAQSPVAVAAVSGACMLLPAAMFRAVGGFTPDYFMYGEDMDLCAKIQQTRGTIVHVPGAEVVHHGGGSSDTQVSGFAMVMMREAGEIYMRRWHGRFAAWRYRLLQGISAGGRLALALPATWMLSGRRQAVARTTVQKWMHVFRWAVGSGIKMPKH